LLRKWFGLSESEKEVIGIRGLEPNLYNQILVKAKEMGKNVSDLVNDALRRYMDQVLAIPYTAPVILGEGATSFRVSKNDLEKLGKVIIRGAVNVKFAEDVDDATVEEHVVAIENCVSVSVPQQVYISVMKKTKNCKSLGSYAINPSPSSQTLEAEGKQLTINAEVARIGDLDKLELSKEDLETLGKRIVLENIEDLKLSPEVDIDTVNKYIEVIRNVETLEVPKSIYMVILTKQKDCETITKY
jgi:hypothetical protein